jgi:hypothetical protein
MALTGIVNLAERLLNQSQTHAQKDQSTPPAPAKASTEKSAPAADATGGSDAFTLPTQTPAADASAQPSGLFSVATSALFSAAANLVAGNDSAADADTSAENAAARDFPAKAAAPAIATAATIRGLRRSRKKQVWTPPSQK